MVDTPLIDSVFVGQPQTLTDEGGTWTSSIYRNRIETPVRVDIGGLAGDKVAQSYHGGPDADICVHLVSHYQHWNVEYDMKLESGFVGENLTIDNLMEEDVCAGDIVRIGTTLAQVTQPRVPCANLARRIGRSDWVKLTIRENRTGFYMRVLEAGMIQAGNLWLLQERLNPEGTIPRLNRCMYLAFDRSYAQCVVNMSGLSEWWKAQTVEKIEQSDSHWTVTMKDE
ncbi:MAG: MOSC domain-containing protein [Chloroflexota bacterium]